VALSHVLPWFPTLSLSSLHLLIFKHPYLTHMKSDFRNFWWYEFNTSFSSHPPFRFPLEEKNLTFNLWEDSLKWQVSLGTSLVDIIFYENQGDICFLWNLGLWILIIQSFQSCTLAYFLPIHLITIEFQNIDNTPGSPPKTFLLLQLL
jgi:hypothetical protein